MKDSILYHYLLESGFLCGEESERETVFTDNILKQQEKLKSILDELQMKEVGYFRHYLIGHMFHIRDIECFKMFYLGVKLGMEVADFCAEEFKEK